MGSLAEKAPETVDRLFAHAIAGDPTRPLLTWYDDGTGERVELSGTTLENWAAKTANLLTDGCGLGTGDRATVLLPPHWQTAAVLLGCWHAGLAVTESTDPGTPTDVLFATAAKAESSDPAPPAAERFALGLAPLGAPLRQVPAGYTDYVVDVRGHGDRFAPYQRVQPQDLARPGQSHRELCAAAAGRADALGIGIGQGARVLIDATAYPDSLDWLLAPLVAGASVVLCAGTSSVTTRTARIAAERVTMSLPHSFAGSTSSSTSPSRQT